MSQAGIISAINSFGSHVLGQPYITTPVVDTHVSGGDVYVEDRTWHTPYVVDANVTVGQRGTFSTIQAAITQAGS